jgi:hypothetical protein
MKPTISSSGINRRTLQSALAVLPALVRTAPDLFRAGATATSGIKNIQAIDIVFKSMRERMGIKAHYEKY